MAKLRTVRGIAIVALVAWVIAGCAGGASRGTVKPVTAADTPALAGTWQGTMTATSGGSFPATMTVRPDGTYAIQGGAYTSQGKAEARDGQLVFVTTATTGGQAVGERTGTAVLMDRGDSWAVVGSGRAPAGPYNFEFSKPK